MKFSPWRVCLLAGFAMLLLTGLDPAAASDRGKPYVVAAGRSPIPQPGESFTEPLAFTRLAAPPPPVQTVRGDDGARVVPWNRAHRHLGETITVQGTIVNTHNHDGRVCFLNFHEDWRGKFYVPLFASAFGDLPEPPEDYFLHKTIRVTGRVTEHRGSPTIEVNDLEQLRFVEP